MNVAGWALSTLTLTPATASNVTLSLSATEMDAQGNLGTTATATELVTVNPPAKAAAVLAASPVNQTDVAQTFVFTPNFGQATINDFYQHVSGGAHDTISLPKSEFQDFAAMLSHTSQYGAGPTQITADNGDQLTLPNLTLTALKSNPSDFIFHG